MVFLAALGREPATTSTIMLIALSFGKLTAGWGSLTLPRATLTYGTFCYLRMTCTFLSELVFLYACINSVRRLRGPSAHLAHDERERFVIATFKSLLASEHSLRMAFNGIWCYSGFQL